MSSCSVELCTGKPSGDRVCVGVGLEVGGATVRVAVAVAVGGTAVNVAVAVAVDVAVAVIVRVGVGVLVDGGAAVLLALGMEVRVAEGFTVAVAAPAPVPPWLSPLPSPHAENSIAANARIATSRPHAKRFIGFISSSSDCRRPRWLAVSHLRREKPSVHRSNAAP
jgi:hypothetical protein